MARKRKDSFMLVADDGGGGGSGTSTGGVPYVPTGYIDTTPDLGTAIKYMTELAQLKEEEPQLRAEVEGAKQDYDFALEVVADKEKILGIEKAEYDRLITEYKQRFPDG